MNRRVRQMVRKGLIDFIVRAQTDAERRVECSLAGPTSSLLAGSILAGQVSGTTVVGPPVVVVGSTVIAGSAAEFHDNDRQRELSAVGH